MATFKFSLKVLTQMYALNLETGTDHGLAVLVRNRAFFDMLVCNLPRVKWKV